ncbi:2231_t:CDS:1, partial [Racocetra fulgida]
INIQESGHEGWQCNYCQVENIHASEINMNTHLILICTSIPLNIKQDVLPIPNKKKQTEHDIASGLQSQINSKFQHVNKIDPDQEQL